MQVATSCDYVRIRHTSPELSFTHNGGGGEGAYNMYTHIIIYKEIRIFLFAKHGMFFICSVCFVFSQACAEDLSCMYMYGMKLKIYDWNLI